MKKRLSNKEFWMALNESKGLYARCAKIITERYGMPYSRQAAKERAEKNTDALMQIIESSLDEAEDILQQLFESKNERIRLKAVTFFLQTKGKDRGYSLRQEISGTDGKDFIPDARVLTPKEIKKFMQDLENEY